MNWCNILIFIFVLNFCAPVQPNAAKDSWVEPNLWNRNVDTEQYTTNPDDEVCRRCSVVMDKEAEENAGDNACTIEGVSLIYYKKFIRNLFNRQKMMQDQGSNVFIRTLTFTVTAEQLENIEKLEDPRDLDMILTDIFGKVKSPYKVTLGGQAYVEDPGTVMLVMDILKDFLQLLKHSNVKFFLIVLSSILCAWYIHRRFHIGIITLIIGGCILFGYFVTYIECNEQLEMDRMLHAIARSEQNQEEKKGFFASIFSSKERQGTKIKKSSKLKWAYCRPDEVAIIYANDMMLKNLEILIEKCTESFTSMKDKFGFPYNIIAAVSLVAMIAYIVKLSFKYILSPRAWASLVSHRPHWTHQDHAAPMAPVAGAPAEDRISGDNLKLLLNVISKTPAIAPSFDGTQLNPAISGVQVILEQIEGNNSPKSSSSKNNSPNSSIDKSANSVNNNANEIIQKFGYEAECNATVEDLPNDEEEENLKRSANM